MAKTGVLNSRRERLKYAVSYSKECYILFKAPSGSVRTNDKVAFRADLIKILIFCNILVRRRRRNLGKGVSDHSFRMRRNNKDFLQKGTSRKYVISEIEEFNQ